MKPQCILCINNGIVYPSLAVASATLGLDKGSISKCLKDERIKVNGLSFVKVTGTETKQELEKIIINNLKEKFNISLNITVSFGEGGEMNG